MISETLMIFGPGGIGKTPLDSIIRKDALRIDPYRLRPAGPRDRADLFYAHEKLRTELTHAFKRLGDRCEFISDKPAVEWFPRSQTVFLDVRGEWQCLILGGLSGTYAKAEIYAPAVPILLGRPETRAFFGTLSIVILNPVEPLRLLDGDLATLKERTAENCSRRGDSGVSIARRTDSIDEEVEAWQAMLELGGLEFPNWEFPEYVYAENRVSALLGARAKLIAGNPALAEFFASEAEIRSCRVCGGTGLKPCPDCGGSGTVEHDLCHGTGVHPYDPGECYGCDGTGWVVCYTCLGQKTVPCSCTRWKSP